MIHIIYTYIICPARGRAAAPPAGAAGSPHRSLLLLSLLSSYIHTYIHTYILLVIIIIIIIIVITITTVSFQNCMFVFRLWQFEIRHSTDT